VPTPSDHRFCNFGTVLPVYILARTLRCNSILRFHTIMIFSLPLLSLVYLSTNTANAYHVPRTLPNPALSDISTSSIATSAPLIPRSTGDESISTSLIVVIVGGGVFLSLVLSIFGIYKTPCSSSRRGSSRYVPSHAELILC
jgi:hypothetical protein